MNRFKAEQCMQIELLLWHNLWACVLAKCFSTWKVQAAQLSHMWIISSLCMRSIYRLVEVLSKHIKAKKGLLRWGSPSTSTMYSKARHPNIKALWFHTYDRYSLLVQRSERLTMHHLRALAIWSAMPAINIKPSGIVIIVSPACQWRQTQNPTSYCIQRTAPQ